MQAPNSCTIFLSSVCVLFVIFKPNFPLDSPNISSHVVMVGIVLGAPSGKRGDWVVN